MEDGQPYASHTRYGWTVQETKEGWAAPDTADVKMEVGTDDIWMVSEMGEGQTVGTSTDVARTTEGSGNRWVMESSEGVRAMDRQEIKTKGRCTISRQTSMEDQAQGAKLVHQAHSDMDRARITISQDCMGKEAPSGPAALTERLEASQVPVELQAPTDPWQWELWQSKMARG